jgi:NAD(P)H-quinone oxidoreductase subunit 6
VSLVVPPDLWRGRLRQRTSVVDAGATKEPPLSVALFYAFAVFTVLSAAGVAFSKNIVYSAFALLGTLFGVAALYVCLAADFVAGAQFLIYIGGVLVLILFAVMLTHRIADVAVSNRSVGSLPALLIVGAAAGVMGRAIFRTAWPTVDALPDAPTTHAIGNAFLGPYVLPFELASFVLLAVLVGAIVVSRKELRS